MYDVMDLIKADYPPALMCDQLNLTAVQTREEIYQCWAAQNRDRFEQIAGRPARSDYADVRAKLRSRKAQRVVESE